VKFNYKPYSPGKTSALWIRDPKSDKTYKYDLNGVLNSVFRFLKNATKILKYFD